MPPTASEYDDRADGRRDEGQERRDGAACRDALFQLRTDLTHREPDADGPQREGQILRRRSKRWRRYSASQKMPRISDRTRYSTAGNDLPRKLRDGAADAQKRDDHRSRASEAEALYKRSPIARETWSGARCRSPSRAAKAPRYPRCEHASRWRMPRLSAGRFSGSLLSAESMTQPILRRTPLVVERIAA